MDQTIRNLLEKRIEDNPTDALFYESVLASINLKDIAPLDDYLSSDIRFDVDNRKVHEFLIDFQNIIFDAAKLNYKAFDFNGNKSYLLKESSILSIVAYGINCLLEELKDKTIPVFYFNEICEIFNTPAMLTNVYGNIKAQYRISEIVNNLDFSDYNINGLNVGQIIPNAFQIMRNVMDSGQNSEFKKISLINSSKPSINYNLTVKHLRKYDDAKYNVEDTEGFIFILTKTK